MVVSVQLVSWWAHEDPSRRALTEKCLRNEKQLAFGPTQRDPIAESAAEGGIELRVEGNGVHVVFAGSENEAREIMTRYETIAGELGDRIEQRGRVVYLWEGRPSPTQRQTLYDCWYG